MNIFDRVIYRLAEWRASSGAGFHVSQTPPGWVDRFAWSSTSAGMMVNEDVALTYSAVFACVRILAETLSSLPWILFEQQGRMKQRARGHPLYSLLHTSPNPEMSSFEFREAMMGHVCTWGNAFAEIDFDRRGVITALWPLRPDRMTVKRENGALLYKYRVPESEGGFRTVTLLPEQVFHVRGLGFDGRIGYSPVGLARQSIGLGLATEAYGGAFFGNGARPSGVLQHPGKLSDTAYDRLKKEFERRHQGLENAQRLAILEEGLKYQQIGVPPEDAQFLETRTFQVREVARWYRVPPHMLADLDRATFSNIEHLSLEFIQYTMLPWFVRWEQAVSRSLLLESERERYYAQLVVDGLLRGDVKSRNEAYAIGRQNGWYSANDIREMEDKNPIEGGDVYLVPLNMIPADQVGAGMPSAESGSDSAARSLPAQSIESERRSIEKRSLGAAAQRHRLQAAWFGTYRDVAARVLRREARDIVDAAHKFLGRGDFNGFSDWLTAFYEEHSQFVYRNFDAVAQSYGQLVADAVAEEIGGEWWDDRAQKWIGAYLNTFATRHCGISEVDVRNAVQEARDAGADAESAVSDTVESWPETRAESTARWESVRFNNALAVGLYGFSGRERIIWRAFGENCPYCTSLNGRTIGINTFFISSGENFQPDGAQSPLTVTNSIRHAPAHDGCDCMVTSGG